MNRKCKTTYVPRKDKRREMKKSKTTKEESFETNRGLSSPHDMYCFHGSSLYTYTLPPFFNFKLYQNGWLAYGCFVFLFVLIFLPVSKA